MTRIIVNGCERGTREDGRLVCNCGTSGALHYKCRVPLRSPRGATSDFITAPPNARRVSGPARSIATR